MKLVAYMSKEKFFALPSAEQKKKASESEVYQNYLKEGKPTSKPAKPVHDGSKKLSKPHLIKVKELKKKAIEKAKLDSKKLRKLNGRDTLKEIHKIGKSMKVKSYEEAIEAIEYLYKLMRFSFPQTSLRDIEYYGYPFEGVNEVIDSFDKTLEKKYGKDINKIDVQVDDLRDVKESFPNNKMIQDMSKADFENFARYKRVVNSIPDSGD